MTKVTAIIPVYNTQDYIYRCIHSIASQTLDDIEIIAVDNGSTDRSYSILCHLKQSIPNLCILQQATGRQGAARNLALSVATGDFVAFIDSDDWIDVNMLSTMHSLATTHNSDVVICESCFYMMKKDIYIPHPTLLTCSPNPFIVFDQPKALRSLMLCNKIFRREFLRNNMLEFEANTLHEDQLFVAKSLLMARSISFSSSILYYYRKERPGSVSESLSSNYNDFICQINRLLSLRTCSSHSKGISLLVEEMTIHRILTMLSSLPSYDRQSFTARVKPHLQYLSIRNWKPLILSPLEKLQYQSYRYLPFGAYKPFQSILILIYKVIIKYRLFRNITHK